MVHTPIRISAPVLPFSELERCMQALRSSVQENDTDDNDEDKDVDYVSATYHRKKQELLKRVQNCNRLFRSLLENIDSDSSAPDSGVDDPDPEPRDDTAAGAVVSADVFRLAEESSRQLIELTRSNEEKRERIRGLVEENRRLTEEHGALQMRLTMSGSRRSEEPKIRADVGPEACNKQKSSQHGRTKSLVLCSLW